MPLDFPSSPTNGQVYGNYYYNSARGAWNALLPAATPNFFTNAQLIDATASSSASSTTPLVVIGSSGQSVDLQQWKDSAGTILSDISSQGALMAQYIEVRNIVGSGLVNGESQFKVVSPDGTKDIRFWNRNDAAGMYYYNSSGGSAGVLRIAHSTTPRLVTQLIQDFTSSNSANFGARVNIDTTAAANIGLVVRGAASQTADLQQWQSSTGAVLSEINSAGELQVPRIGVGSTMPTTARLQSTASAATEVPIIARGAASQTADLQQWQDSAGTVLADIDSLGRFTATNQPAFSVQGTGTQSWSGAQVETKVAIGAGVTFINNGNHYSSANSRFTAPVAGIYLFNASLAITSNQVGPEFSFYKNGVSFFNNAAIGYDSTYNTFGNVFITTLAANDYIEVFLRNNNATSFTLDRARCSFSGIKIA